MLSSLAMIPSQTLPILQKLLLIIFDKNPGTVFYTDSNEKINIEDFPTKKTGFNLCFNTVVTNNVTRRLLLALKFALRKSSTLSNPPSWLL
jgi:hypothetical protein